LGFFGTLRFVVLPQAFRTMVQPLVNVFIGTVIGSALCSALAVSEITWVTPSLNIQYAQAVVMFLLAGDVYLSMSLGGAFLGGALERAVAPSGEPRLQDRAERAGRCPGMSAKPASATQVLFDTPGPRGRRRILLLSILSVLAIAAMLAAGLWQFASNGQLDPNTWVVYLRADYLAFLGTGLLGTLQVTAIAAVVAFPFGLLLALGRLSRLRPLSWISTVWIEFFRGIPMLLVVYGF